jgi:hypothetical protein
VQCSRDETLLAMATIQMDVALRKPRSFLLAAALLSLALSGCGLTVSTFSINDAAYKAMWAKDWGAINGDAGAFAPSIGSPGSCNTGGTKSGCYDASVKVADDLQTLVNDLTTTSTPSQYTTASATLDQAAHLEIVGLKLRAQSLTAAESTSPQDNAMFAQGQADIHQASPKFSLAYSAFPSYDQPLPRPFPAGYSG